MLFGASGRGELEKVQKLLREGADVNWVNLYFVSLISYIVWSELV